MKILLIGGTGVLSSAVAKQAICSGAEVTMINRGRRTLPEGVSVIKTDKRNYAYIEKCLEGCFFDAVIDFLCLTQDDLKNSFLLYSRFAKQYFFISTCAVYDKTYPGIKNEDSPKGLRIWKYSTEMALSKDSRCKCTVIRPCVTYGDTRIPYGISPQYGYHWTLCARVLAGKPLIRWNGGSNRSNMMRVEDLAVGVVGLIGNPHTYNEAFNICGDETPSFNDVLVAMEDCLKCKIPVVDISSEFYAKELPEQAGEILGGRSIDSINSNRKIKSIVPDFKQTILLKDGVAKTIAAYKNRNYQKGIDWKFDADCDRIIKKWCRQNGIDSKGMNLRFVDYLGNATNRNRIEYALEFYSDNIFVLFAKKNLSLFRRLMRKIKGK